MELSSLKTFIAVVDEAGIRGASEKLHTVKSNITSRIQRLEEELGTKLFEKQGRRLEMTLSGHALYEYANQIIQLERQAKTQVRLVSNSYELHIGTPEPFAAVHLPKALQFMRRDHPQIHPKIHTGTSAELTIDILNKRLDCAIVGGAVENPDLIAIPIVQEKMVMVSARECPDKTTLIIRREGCAYREHALAWQRKSGHQHEETMIMTTVDGLLGCVAGGLGYSIISEPMVTDSRYESLLNVEPLPSDGDVMNISLIHHKNAIPVDGIRVLAGFFTNAH